MKRTGKSPTVRSLELCRKLGWTADIAEKWVPMKFHPGGGQRKDLFGCIDVLALTPYGIIGIQACSRGDHKKRLDKALLVPELKEWLRAKAGFVVWSWDKPRANWNVKAQGITFTKSDIGPRRLEAIEPMISPGQEMGPQLSGILNAG